MKRVGLVVILTIGLIALLFSRAPSPSNAPRFIPGRASPVGNYSTTHYDWISLRPFVNDRFWLFGTRDKTNRFTCLYDLKARMILGELIDGGVVCANSDGTKLLCVGRDTSIAGFKNKLLNLLQKISGGRFRPNFNRTESFWVLNLNDNSSARVGAASQYSGSGSRWYSTPDLRYACTSPTTEDGTSFLLFDFADSSLIRVPVGGYIRGWWDQKNIFLQTSNHDFALYDVEKKQTTTLFSAETIRATLNQLKLPSDPANVETFANWNGTDYDFYIAETQHELSGKPSFLLKADRTSPNPALKLVAEEFQFEWGGRFDAKATKLLYQGESGAAGQGGNGAVYLRDLSDDSTRTLVPPDNRGQYSIPRFYGDEVIYYRDRVLWRIGLDGSNNVPLFPPPSPNANP